MIGIFGKPLEIWKDCNLGVSEGISQGDQLWVQEVYTYNLYVDICMYTHVNIHCTYMHMHNIFEMSSHHENIGLDLIWCEGGDNLWRGSTVWIWNAYCESILASMEFHSSEDLGCSLQTPSLQVSSSSLLFSDFTWTFLLLHKGVRPFWSQISHMCWFLCPAVSTTTSLCGDSILLQGQDLLDYIRFPAVFSENTAFGWLYLSKSAAICLFE